MGKANTVVDHRIDVTVDSIERRGRWARIVDEAGDPFAVS